MSSTSLDEKSNMKLKRRFSILKSHFGGSSSDDEHPTFSRLDYYPQQASCQILTLSFLLEKFLGRKEFGSFVEVGAYDGLFASNSWGLAKRGWNGWMIEPVPALAELCRVNYAGYDEIIVVQCAIGAQDNSEVELHVADTLTTANKEAFDEYKSVGWAKSVLTPDKLLAPATTLDSFLIKYGVPRDFDLLIVDVEGFETEVFSGFSINSWKPKMIIAELADTHPDLTATASDDSKLYRDLIHAGYTVVYKDYINTVLVRNEVYESCL